MNVCWRKSSLLVRGEVLSYFHLAHTGINCAHEYVGLGGFHYWVEGLGFSEDHF